MEIILFRHGKPDIDTNKKLSPLEFGHWVSAYNAADITNKSRPSDDAINKAKSCKLVICSHLPRSTSSARALGIKHIHIQEPTFREFDMPYANWTYPKFKPQAWSIVFRLLWLLGFSNNAEPYDTAKERAATCLSYLTALAKEHDSVIFVGHGALNMALVKLLLNNGWTGPKRSPRKHWEYSVYQHTEA